MSHVGRCASHIKSHDFLRTGLFSGSDGPDHSTRRPRENGVFSAKLGSARQTTVRLHEKDRHVWQRLVNAINVAVQHWREVRVDQSRLTTGNELNQLAYFMAERDLGEPDSASNISNA